MKKRTKTKKLSASKQRLVLAIQDDLDRATFRGETAYAKVLKESLNRVLKGDKV